MTLDIVHMAKDSKGYPGKIRRKIAESHIGDEKIDIDFDTLYGSREDDEESVEENVDVDVSDNEAIELIDWDEDVPEQESYSDVDESAQRDSVFDVDDSAYGDSVEEFDPEDFEQVEALMSDDSDDYEDEAEYEVDYESADSTDDYDSDLDISDEERNSPSAFAKRLSSGASGLFSKVKESSEKKPKEKKVKEKKVKEKKEKKPKEEKRESDSAFDVSEEDSDSIISKIASKGKKGTKERIKAATDILEVLGVPETFAIEEAYYLPEDLKDIEFDEEAPIGYDRKEVKRFRNNVKLSIQHYVELLEERNSHVMTLASELDKKDEVIARIQLDQELAQGINIIPTQGDQHLENELMDAQVTIARLRAEKEEALAKADGAKERIEQVVGLSQGEREKYNELQDDYAKQVKANEDLAKRVSELKSRILLLEEEAAPDPSEEFVFEETPAPMPQPSQLPAPRPAPMPQPQKSGGTPLPKF